MMECIGNIKKNGETVTAEKIGQTYGFEKKCENNVTSIHTTMPGQTTNKEIKYFLYIAFINLIIY